MPRPLSDASADFPSLRRTLDGRPLLMFDGPAGTQVPTAVIEAISSYYKTSNANTGGAFSTSIETDQILHNTREQVATFLGAPSWSTISFGQNMTTLTFSLSRALARTMKAGDEIVITELDHEANRGPWLALRREGIVVREAAMNDDGRLDYDHLEQLINARTRLVAMGMASNALGTVNDFRRIRQASRRVGAWLLLDAVHYAPHFSIDVSELDPDFLLCSAYKFYGPHVGLLYVREGLLDELDTDRLITAAQEAPERIETGTLNHAAIAGVGASIAYIASWGEGGTLRDRLIDAMKRIGKHERALATRYWEALGEIPGVRRWGPGMEDLQRAPTVSITVARMPTDELAKQLARRGIAVWSGHFYAKRAVEKLGLDASGGILRTGFFLYNTEAEVDRLCASVREIASSL